MVITKTSEQVENFKHIQEIANYGCNVCPCCGETITFDRYAKYDCFSKGVMKLLAVKQWTEGIFKTRFMQSDLYRCLSCGAEWESKPYQYM